MGVQLLSFTPGSAFISASPHTEVFQWSFCNRLIFTPTHQTATARTRISRLLFPKQTHNFSTHPQTVLQQNRPLKALVSPFFAVRLSAVVSVDVEWAPNPLKEHVGTVCISFSHLGERPQPSLFTGIPCPLSVQPQPKALA